MLKPNNETSMIIPSSEVALFGKEYQFYDSLYHYYDRLKTKI